MMRVIVIAGPTGVGKSRVAVEVARKLDGEVVSADSRQVYKFMRIGTDRLGPAEMEGVPHHLTGFLDPSETYSAGLFAREASGILRDISERGKVPLVCGGTGFYIKALLEGLFDEHAVVANREQLDRVREALADELERYGPEELHRRLAEIDPDSAFRIHPNDSQRIIRALEIFEISGLPLSEHQKEEVKQEEIKACKICLTIPRQELYDRIDSRVEIMLEGGLVEEVEDLKKRGFGKDTPAFDSLGYVEILEYLEGDKELGEAISEIKKETRRYAKRQLTWFRREEGYHWITQGNDSGDKVIEAWYQFLTGEETLP
jgi:tRNA dimethylallyltransferase